MNDIGIIKSSASTDYENNVKMLILSRNESLEMQPEHVIPFSFNTLRSIRKKADKMTLHERHFQQLAKKREHSATYEKTPQRKLSKAKYKNEYVSAGKRQNVEEKRRKNG